MKKIKAFSALLIALAFILTGCANTSGSSGQSEAASSASAGGSSAQPEKTWETVKEFSSNEKEGISEVFELSGGNVRITYDIVTTTKDQTIDSGTALIYILPEGYTKTQDDKGQLKIAVQDISTVGTKTGESKTIQKPAGKYYIDINTSSVASYNIKVEEEK